MDARRSSGLAIRKLASRADVAGSTITRIQSGAIDPTVSTLERILNAAGFELRLEAVRSDVQRSASLADVSHAWSTRSGELRLDWTAWRSFLDRLDLHPELVPEAIYAVPSPTGERIVDALLAGVAEKIADDAGLPRPLWTERAPSLDHEFRPQLARPRVEHQVPPQLAARGLMVDTESLWRRPENVGV